MAGVFTDNQPDFSFLAPGETRTFSQCWYPIRAIGPAAAANREAAVSLRVTARVARVGVAVTTPHPGRRASALDGAGRRRSWTGPSRSRPSAPFVTEIDLDRAVEPARSTAADRDRRRANDPRLRPRAADRATGAARPRPSRRRPPRSDRRRAVADRPSTSSSTGTRRGRPSRTGRRRCAAIRVTHGATPRSESGGCGRATCPPPRRTSAVRSPG